MPPAPAPPPEKHRPTRGEVEQRVNSIVTMIATRSRYEEIVRFAATQWGVNSRQADNYIARANAIILAEAKKDREQRIAEHLAALDAVIKRAYAIDDLTSMRAAIAEKSKLCGDYPAAKVEHSGEIGVLTPEQMEKKRQERLQQVYPSLLSLATMHAMDDIARQEEAAIAATLPGSDNGHSEGAHEA